MDQPGFVHHALIQMVLTHIIRTYFTSFVMMMGLEIIFFVVNRTVIEKIEKNLI